MAVQTLRPLEWTFLRRSGASWRFRMLRLWFRLTERYRFSSITRRIIFLNAFALVLLVAGLMYLNQSESDLIQARMQTLATQAEIIAGAIGKTGAPAIAYDANSARASSSSRRSFDAELSRLSFRINPEFVAPMLRDLVGPTKTRARIYDSEGILLLDSLKLYARGQVSRMDIPSLPQPQPGWIERILQYVRSLLSSQKLPAYKDAGADGKAYDEVRFALGGTPTQIIRVNDNGYRVMNVAAPIERSKNVLGVLLLTTEGSDIDEAIANQRRQIVYLALFVIGVTIFLSFLLASTIAGPMRRLAIYAERVRKNIKAREQVPDFTHRKDEIGHLASALRDMTNALYLRMDAIESFAADVAHELKNPLTSLRSAAGMLDYVKTDEDKKKLIDIIQHDVRRLDRLITDISDASRLDAELARDTAKPVNVAHLLSTLCTITNDTRCKAKQAVRLHVEGSTAASLPAPPAYTINGHDSRLSQVITNLLENALSFSPPGGEIRVSARPLSKTREIEILIEDQGPGIRPENLERIFERFYTDRPEHEEFGQNSGLGLHISKQIIEAHGGRIWAENRTTTEFGVRKKRKPAAKNGKGEAPVLHAMNGETHPVAGGAPLSMHAHGACFVIRLPAAAARF